ncbi:hypothetical protein [Thioalkalivibrio sp. ALE20]|uniref:DUF350 domain-containing protein n=1 Tax=Thioalkalivibrio sp. ALE20 TaxID=545275 RepID=UPI00037834A7|nr:hypothetical protein [Thioalkalivibrio sp. ALE20]
MYTDHKVYLLQKMVGPLMIGVWVGALSAVFFYEADIFWPDTGVVFGMALVISFFGLLWNRASRLHPLYRRGNAAIGAVRLGIILGFAWCLWVLVHHADPTIEGFWFVLYALMAFAAIKVFGQVAGQLFGPRLQVDVFERGNLAAGVFLGAFVLATGMIFGGASWGDLEAGGLEYGWIFEVLPGYEDGWWITPWFFGMGWLILVVTLGLWIRREKTDFYRRVVRDRNMEDAKAAAYFMIACAITLTYAVHGDYRGFGDALIGFSVIALPVLGHEVMRPPAPLHTGNQAGDQTGDEGVPAVRSRDREGVVYILLALGGVVLAPLVSTLLGLRG